MRSCFFYRTKIGRIGIEEFDGKIARIYFEDEEVDDLIDISETVLIRNAYIQLDEYFEGKRKSFDLPLHLGGTEFQLDVWRVLCTIPYGKTITYADVAKKIGNKDASRAVGGACNANPIPIIVPCHRVVGANDKLVGYKGGTNIKRILLNLERDVERTIKQ